MTGAVIRRAARPSDNFAQISNTTLDDPRLSWKATGLLAHLLSRPIGWGTTAQELWKSRSHSGEGRDVIYAALKELETYGYLRRARVRGAGGQFTWEQEVYDTPVDNPGDGPTSWEPGDGPLPDHQEPADQEPVSQESTTKKENQEESHDPPGRGGEVTTDVPVDNLAPRRPLARPDRCVDHQEPGYVAEPCPACRDARYLVAEVERDVAARPLPQCEHGRVRASCPFCPGGELAHLEAS